MSCFLSFFHVLQESLVFLPGAYPFRDMTVALNHNCVSGSLAEFLDTNIRVSLSLTPCPESSTFLFVFSLLGHWYIPRC